MNTAKKRKLSDMESSTSINNGRWKAYIKSKCIDKGKRQLSKAHLWQNRYRADRRRYVAKVDEAADEFKEALQWRLAKLVLIDLITEFLIPDSTINWLKALDDATKENNDNNKNK